ATGSPLALFEAMLPDWVTVHGFIDKRTEHGEATLSKLYARSHFHVLFSKAEAFGCVFAEANAHATPNVSYDLGGISTAVRNNRGGQTFAVSDPIECVAYYIESAMRHRDCYQILAQRARAEYDDRLNCVV